MGKRIKPGDKALDFIFNTPWKSSREFYESVQNQNAILVFLRYHGCPVCQMEMANLKRGMELFGQRNTKVFVFFTELDRDSCTFVEGRRLAL